MRSTFRSGVGVTLVSLFLFVGGSLGTVASAQSLTASLATDRGCGSTALYNLGESNRILFSVSQNASVTLRLQRPDGTVSTFLANQPLLGGVTYAINGVIGNPLGQRLLTLDAVAGTQRAHAECTYTARAVTQALVVTLQTNRGCGGTALSVACSESKSRCSSSRSASGVWKADTPRERLGSRRTSWKRITSPLVEYRNGTPYSPW